MDSSIKEIAGIISEVTGMPAEKIQADSKLIEDLNLSSLHIMVIFSEIAGRFDVDVTEEQLLSVRTVGDLAKIMGSN